MSARRQGEQEANHVQRPFSTRLKIMLPALMVLALQHAAVAQQTSIGIAPVVVRDEPYLFDTAEQHPIRVEVVVRGLNRPFSLAFLPNGDALITERGTRLRLVKNAARAGEKAELVAEPIQGTPTLPVALGVGLQEVAVSPDFANDGFVYISYNKPGMQNMQAAPNTRPPTAVVVARARFDGTRLVGLKEILVGEELAGGSGSRLAFGPNDTLFITTGAPFTREAQNLGTVYGKVLRIRTDGSVPPDNPFVGKPGARSEIYSFGHRDQLGLTLHPVTGAVLGVEYGPQGGDEANLILPGRNYGWPDYSFGRTYEGPRVSALPFGDDTEQPLLVWLPSIAPTGMTFYSGSRFPAWKGNLFVGSSQRGQVPRTGGLERIVFNERLEELRRETLLTELHQRIRDVRQGPDGLLYVITDESAGALLRISPAP
jgi:aldose sugar dehydrogenase